MKVLITGSKGQLGKALIKCKPSNLELISTTRENFNLLNFDQCRKLISETKPDWIINAAAYTAVDLAEDEAEKANIINGEAPTEIAKIIKEVGGNLLHISTDFIFDGLLSRPYQVDDKPNPINMYGRTKLSGENGIKNVLSDSDQFIILRTSWVMGAVGKNFILTMLKLHQQRETISVVYDQIGCMTSTSSLAKTCWLIIQKKIEDTKHINNTLHWTEAGVSSWYDIAYEIGDLAVKMKLLDKSAKVFPISSNEFPTKAKRPNFSLLNCSLTKKLLNIENKYWRYALEEILQEIKSENLFDVS